ncbi:hypothetical protein EON65_45960 [archaeon]|nr:MAG: hypothetical protein EON65_45960 [archaeon]
MASTVFTASNAEKAVLLSIVLGLYLTEPLQEMRVVLVFVVLVALVEGFQWAKHVSSPISLKPLSKSSTTPQQTAAATSHVGEAMNEVKVPKR